MVTISPEPTDSTTNATLVEENKRLRETLERIQADHVRQTETWQHKGPTELADRWHDGYVTACASHSIWAREALDPEAAAEDERSMRLAATGSDADWYRATGHCGACGDVATNCGCDGKCGCFRLHGPRKEPYRSPQELLAEAVAERDRYAAWLREVTEAEWSTPCRLDHNGDCQEHGYFGGPCPIPSIAATLEPQPELAI
jgi:hypothetical protein